MAVRSTFALLCLALLCGLAASSVVQSETETETELTMTAKRMRRQGNFEFRSCDYLDLVEVGYRPGSDYDCSPGDQFLFKAAKGLRRQFLVTPETNIIVLLKRGEKVRMCNNVFRDVTEHVKCKPVPGVKEITTIGKKARGKIYKI